MPGWSRGEAAACKGASTGSNPVPGSTGNTARFSPDAPATVGVDHGLVLLILESGVALLVQGDAAGLPGFSSFGLPRLIMLPLQVRSSRRPDFGLSQSVRGDPYHGHVCPWH